MFLTSALASLAGCNGSDAQALPTGPADIEHGAQVFRSVCAQCHGLDARGVKGLGADLRTSPFLRENSDRAVLAMIREGKPATTEHPAMPPKGGRLDLTDQDLQDVVAYIRTLQE